jgi:hypothetical protein
LTEASTPLAPACDGTATVTGNITLSEAYPAGSSVSVGGACGILPPLSNFN